MKVDFGITYNNGDTQHTHSEDIFVESSDSGFVAFAEAVKGAASPEQALKLLHQEMTKGAFLYKHLLELFSWRGHQKLDWDDVMVSFDRIDVGDKSFEISEETISAVTFYNVSTIQIENASPIHMYFIEEL
jgi:hypothetical protein